MRVQVTRSNKARSDKASNMLEVQSCRSCLCSMAQYVFVDFRAIPYYPNTKFSVIFSARVRKVLHCIFFVALGAPLCACVRVRVCVCFRASACACVRACSFACVCARMCTCGRAQMYCNYLQRSLHLEYHVTRLPRRSSPNLKLFSPSFSLSIHFSTSTWSDKSASPKLKEDRSKASARAKPPTS